MMVGGFLKLLFEKKVPRTNVKNSFPTAAQTLGNPPSIFREKDASK